MKRHREAVLTAKDSHTVQPGSTDAGDVSYITPFAQFAAAAWPFGVAFHSWQAVASSGSGIANAAMLTAAKVLAGCVYDVMTDGGQILDAAKNEHRRTLNGFSYVSPILDGVRPKAHH